MRSIEQDGLSSQLQAARESHKARYIITALVGDVEHDVGETMLGPELNVAMTKAMLMRSVGERLRRFSLSEDQIAGAIIQIAEAPLLY